VCVSPLCGCGKLQLQCSKLIKPAQSVERLFCLSPELSTRCSCSVLAAQCIITCAEEFFPASWCWRCPPLGHVCVTASPELCKVLTDCSDSQCAVGVCKFVHLSKRCSREQI
jgi:hypothetical protein